MRKQFIGKYTIDFDRVECISLENLSVIIYFKSGNYIKVFSNEKEYPMMLNWLYHYEWIDYAPSFKYKMVFNYTGEMIIPDVDMLNNTIKKLPQREYIFNSFFTRSLMEDIENQKRENANNNSDFKIYNSLYISSDENNWLEIDKDIYKMFS